MCVCDGIRNVLSFTCKYDLNVESFCANVSSEVVSLFSDLMMPMNVTATATSPTTINVRWEPPPFVDTIDHYFVSWMPVGLPRGVFLGGGMEEIDCVSSNTPLPGYVNCTDVMEFDITGLEEHIEYQVMVLASNDVGNSTSGMDTERTLPDGEYMPTTHTYVFTVHTNAALQMMFMYIRTYVFMHILTYTPTTAMKHSSNISYYICSVVCTVFGSDI